ncbi:MAG: dehydrogenase [Gemmatimonadales bacterium]|nr:MAG: dehydrogenase [Gemmatimonadales bacterium]
MPTSIDQAAATTDVMRYGLEPADLLSLYRTIYLSRRIDDREMLMKRQQKIFFQISGAGHEAVLAAAGKAMRPGYDWFYTYYRDRALCLQLGVTPYEMFLQGVGAAEDPASGGRQMPSHWGHADHNIVSVSSPTGTQFLQAVGCAEAGVRAEGGGLGDSVAFEEDEVVLVTTGDGTTSEGEFWEALNTASNLKLPVVFLVEDNGYAISVPVEVNTAGGSISRLVSSFPDFLIREVDGTDPIASYGAMQEAVAHCRARKGPALVHAHVTRPYSHSMSDDERMYKPETERASESERDPVVTFAVRLVAEGIASEEELQTLRDELDARVVSESEQAETRHQPGADTVYDHVFSPDMDATEPARFSTEPDFEGDETTVVDLLNVCLRDEMRRDPSIVVFGEDVADVSREEYLDELKGKGGVFKVTAGLQREFGSNRVFNSPLAEANIVGRAVGMATRGLKPVVEVQFFDYIWPAFHQLRNEVATMRWRSGGHFKCPLVVRTTYGGYLAGGAMYHSQTGASLFTHTPGMHVVCPSNAEDANGLLRTAIRCDDPVLFLEHKHLYRQTYNKGRNPGPEYMIPFGQANVVEEGLDVTVVTYGALVERTRKAIRQLEKEGRGIDVELIDLRTLNPLDMETIGRSLKKTNRVLVAYEDSKSWGFGAEISARIADELFEWLDAPVRRVASTDTFVGYAPSLEAEILPQVSDIAEAIAEISMY